jgi:hypothetical protein
MKHDEEIQNLRERLTQLRQALKSPSRSKTPTKARTPINTSRNVSPNASNNYTPLSKKSSISKISDISVASSVNVSVNSYYIPLSVASSKQSIRNKSKSPLREIQLEADQIQNALQQEIEMKIEICEKLESSVEQLKELLQEKKQERRNELDKNIVLHTYVIKYNNNKTDLDLFNKEIENIKNRIEKLKRQTAEIRQSEEIIKGEINSYNVANKELRNENTVMKVKLFFKFISSKIKK